MITSLSGLEKGLPMRGLRINDKFGYTQKILLKWQIASFLS